MGSVFPSSSLRKLGDNGARIAFQGSLVRFPDGALFVCPLKNAVYECGPSGNRHAEILLFPLGGGNGKRFDGTALGEIRPKVLLGILSEPRLADATERRGYAAGRVKCLETGAALGDCDPAADALNAASSGKAQMSSLLAAARVRVKQWLGVSLPREWNLDADRLSHPSLLEAVLADARAAGLAPSVVRIPDHCWSALRVAAALGLAD